MTVECVLCRLEDSRVGGEPQVVIGTEIQYILPLVRTDLCSLRADDDPFLLVKSGIPNLLNFLGQLRPHIRIHR